MNNLLTKRYSKNLRYTRIFKLNNNFVMNQCVDTETYSKESFRQYRTNFSNVFNICFNLVSNMLTFVPTNEMSMFSILKMLCVCK